MSGVFTNTSGNAMLDSVLTGTMWFSLHTENPTTAGLAISELVGGDYVRQDSTITAASGRTTSNAEDLFWDGLPATTIKYIGVNTAETLGTLVYYLPLPSDIVVAEGGRIFIAAHDYAISL